MATTASITPMLVGEASVTIGEVSAATTETFTITIPTQIPTSAIAVATIGSTIQDGLSLGHAWVSAAGTLSVKIINATAGALTPTGDPVTVKYIIF